jgi:hypothetical protein
VLGRRDGVDDWVIGGAIVVRVTGWMGGVEGEEGCRVLRGVRSLGWEMRLGETREGKGRRRCRSRWSSRLFLLRFFVALLQAS